MRDIFVRELLRRARLDKRIILVSGDLGFGVLDQYSTELPKQFLNVGVAEQNMTGMAAGMAIEGRNVFTYSIGNFPTLRCLEQIRNDILYHGVSVNIVAIGGGFSYGALGMSHHATEDIAIIRALPGIRVFAPCDEIETIALVGKMVEDPAPSYLRLDKSIVTQTGVDAFEYGKIRQMRHGENVALVAYGGVVANVIAAAEMLESIGISCAVYSAHTLKPFDKKMMLNLGKKYNAICTIEEHVPSGGLRSLAAETFLCSGVMPKYFSGISLPDKFSSIVGSQSYLQKCFGLDPQSIVERVRCLTEGG